MGRADPVVAMSKAEHFPLRLPVAGIFWRANGPCWGGVRADRIDCEVSLLLILQEKCRIFLHLRPVRFREK